MTSSTIFKMIERETARLIAAGNDPEWSRRMATAKTEILHRQHIAGMEALLKASREVIGCGKRKKKCA